MKKLLASMLIGVLLALGTSVSLPAVEAASYRVKASDVRVKGYYKKSGTYVQPYYRSKADGIKSNNYGRKYR